MQLSLILYVRFYWVVQQFEWWRYFYQWADECNIDSMSGASWSVWSRSSDWNIIHIPCTKHIIHKVRGYYRKGTILAVLLAIICCFFLGLFNICIQHCTEVHLYHIIQRTKTYGAESFMRSQELFS